MMTGERLNKPRINETQGEEIKAHLGLVQIREQEKSDGGNEGWRILVLPHLSI